MSPSAAMAVRGPSSARPTMRLVGDLLAAYGATSGVEIWAWCLMPNHVHLISWCRPTWTGHVRATP